MPTAAPPDALHAPAPRPLQVALAGGDGTPAKVVGYDEDKDVAVLKIDLKDVVRWSVWWLLGVWDSRRGGPVGGVRRGQGRLTNRTW